ncbi:MAG: Cu(I)-responsive transcriptional regulator [Pseudomonadota bacterium]
MNIGQAAKASGISSKMLRHYEAIGLIKNSQRTLSGYRTYSENDIRTLRFIKQARILGFSLEQIGQLMSLWQDRSRASADVKALAQVHIRELTDKINELSSMRDALETLVHACHGDERPDCPILLGLSERD